MAYYRETREYKTHDVPGLHGLHGLSHATKSVRSPVPSMASTMRQNLCAPRRERKDFVAWLVNYQMDLDQDPGSTRILFHICVCVRVHHAVR